MIKYEYKTDPTFLFPNKLQRPKSPTYTRIPIKIIRCEKKKKKENELNENPKASLRKDNEYSKYLLFAIFLFHFLIIYDFLCSLFSFFLLFFSNLFFLLLLLEFLYS